MPVKQSQEAVQPSPTPKRFHQEKKPTWTMDIMILANLNDLSKVIDEAAMQVETGNIQEIVTWKAALRQFYRNIKSFLEIPVAYIDAKTKRQVQTTLSAIAEQSFQMLDQNINIAQRTMPINEMQLQECLMILANLNEMFYHARNDLFMKMISVISPERKALDYAYSGLADQDKEDMIQESMKTGGGFRDESSDAT